MDLHTRRDAAAAGSDSSPQCDIVGTAGSSLPSDLAERIDNAREEERLALAREMHDDIGGTLSALKLQLAGLRRLADPHQLQSRIDEMSVLLDGAMFATERIIRALRPGILDQGLVPALEWEAREFERRTGIPCTFSSNRPNLEVPKGQTLAIYRICQEALNNVAKHALASGVEVHLFRDADAITLEVSDDGQGFNTALLNESRRFGVLGMRERAQAYGGWVDVNSARGKGTTIMVSIPLRRVEDVPS